MSTTIDNANQQKRYGFWGSALPTDWSILAQGTGQTVTVSGGSLTIGMGTTINAITTIRCNNPLTVKSLVRFIASISQRIANNTIYFEVTNADGSTFARFVFTGTSATAANIESSNHSNVSTAKSIGTPPSSAAFFVADVSLEIEQAIFAISVADASALKTCSALFDRNIPETGENYFVQIKVVNGGVAPASSTNVVLDAVIMEDLTMVGVEILRGSGDLNPASGMPVNVINTLPVHPVSGSGTFTVAGSGTFTVGGVAANNAAASGNPVLLGGYATGIGAIPAVGAAADVMDVLVDLYGRVRILADPNVVNYADTAVVLAGAATYTGTSRDVGVPRNFSFIRAFVYASHAGTFYIDVSVDGTTWRTGLTQAVTADTSYTLELKLVLRYVRVRYVNGATLQTAFVIESQLQSD